MAGLSIDPGFRDKIPPLTEEEFTLLEENILSDGAVFSPLIVWEGTVLDGHNRYEIILRHPELTYDVHEMQFANRYEALSWICRNQLGRRNLTPQQKKYLIGQRYEAEKMAHGGDRKRSSDQNGHLTGTRKTRERIAEETHTSQGYVQRASDFAKGVDAAEEALPGIRREILDGTLRPSAAAVAAVARAGPEKRLELAAALKAPGDGGTGNPGDVRNDQRRRCGDRPSRMREIDKISAEMERPKDMDAEAGMLFSLEGETDSFIELCSHTFLEFPRLLSDGYYRQEVVRIMQKLKRYILDIEGGRTE